MRGSLFTASGAVETAARSAAPAGIKACVLDPLLYPVWARVGVSRRDAEHPALVSSALGPLATAEPWKPRPAEKSSKISWSYRLRGACKGIPGVVAFTSGRKAPARPVA